MTALPHIETHYQFAAIVTNYHKISHKFWHFLRYMPIKVLQTNKKQWNFQEKY